MMLRGTLLLVGILTSTTLFAGEDFQLPPEVTPALRAACESDVRRLCIGDNPTIAKVKGCIEQKFPQLGTRCKMAIASAGYTPRSATPGAASGP